MLAEASLGTPTWPWLKIQNSATSTNPSTKIGSKMGGEFIHLPKMVDHHSYMSEGTTQWPNRSLLEQDGAAERLGEEARLRAALAARARAHSL